MSQSMEESTTPEHSEETQELTMKIISLHGSLNDTEKSPFKATLSLDRSESQVMRLMQQTRDLQETVNPLQDACNQRGVGTDFHMRFCKKKSQSII